MSQTYGAYTYEDPNLIKRWLHQNRFKKARQLLDLKREDVFLDYGCGDGHLLFLLKNILPAENLFGFEPVKEMLNQAKKNLKQSQIKLFNASKELLNRKFDKISCLDTCEHLKQEDLEILFKNIKFILNREGFFLISVPIETGPAAFFKNIYRFINGKKYDDLNKENFLKAILGLKIQRRAREIENGLDYYFSHVGFNHCQFEKELKKHFYVIRRIAAPLPFFGSFFNNTLYFLCRKA